MLIKTIVSTGSGRIFAGGSDCCVYEIRYQVLQLPLVTSYLDSLICPGPCLAPPYTSPRFLTSCATALALARACPPCPPHPRRHITLPTVPVLHCSRLTGQDRGWFGRRTKINHSRSRASFLLPSAVQALMGMSLCLSDCCHFFSIFFLFFRCL